MKHLQKNPSLPTAVLRLTRLLTFLLTVPYEGRFARRDEVPRGHHDFLRAGLGIVTHQITSTIERPGGLERHVFGAVVEPTRGESRRQTPQKRRCV